MNATQKDQDTVNGYGPFINFVLFLKNGHLDELQIYKDDGSALIKKPDANEIISIYTDRIGSQM